MLAAAEEAFACDGLKIVDALSGRWWVERSTRRRTVHVRLPLN